ncbi:MAG: hypothetical protein ACTIJ6_06400 [Leucobacter sp.]
MSRTFARRACETFIAVAFAATLPVVLSACAPEPVPEPSGSPSSEPSPSQSNQSISDACGVGGEKVDALMSDLQGRVQEARDEVTSGTIPDLQLLTDVVLSDVGDLTAGISNGEVLSALDEVKISVQEFSDITPPESLFGAPGYLSSLASQVQEVQDAGAALQSLCSTQ